VAKLSDLGLAKRTDEASHLTAARQGFGTPFYMPYEQAINAKYADGRSDIYALGATLYHLVAGEVPFPGSNHIEIVEKKDVGKYPPASAHNPKVPPGLDTILARMLAREPAERYQTVSELIVDLERSGLAAAVPSFIDPDRAMQDPLVRERLTAPAQATAPDMRLPQREAKGESRNGNPDIWYLRYQDQSGRWCKAKATTEQVVKRLRQRRFTAKVEASHLHNGEFLALADLDEFRAVVAELARSKKLRGSSARHSVLTSGTAGSKTPPRASSSRRAVPSRVWVITSVIAVVGIAMALVLAKVLLGQ
jgi:serine/threonine protein kinase